MAHKNSKSFKVVEIRGTAVVDITSNQYPLTYRAAEREMCDARRSAYHTYGRSPAEVQFEIHEVWPNASECAAFVQYCMEFYGAKGIYPMNATTAQVVSALQMLFARGDTVAFDSVDREKVRDILIAKFGLVFPKPEIANNNHKQEIQK